MLIIKYSVFSWRFDLENLVCFPAFESAAVALLKSWIGPWETGCFFISRLWDISM